MTPDTHAVIVRWRGGDEVKACLRSVLANGGDRLDSVTLVDSGSGDDGAARLAEEFPSIRVVALERNLGFAHAANRGAAGGGAPRLLLLNPDTELRTGSLDILAAGLDDDPEAAGTVPLLVGSDDNPQHRWQLRRLPSVARLAMGRSGAPAFSVPPHFLSPVPQPAAAAWLIRQSVWDALGGLNEAFAPAWWEDVDFCARLEDTIGNDGFPARKGFLICPTATILHRGGSSVAALGPEAFAAAYYGNLLRYASTHHGRWFGTIRVGLRLTLTLRSISRPARRAAHEAALEAVRRATPPVTGRSPT